MAGMKHLNADEALAEKGSRVLNRKNCIGCHQIDGLGGEILKNYADDLNEGPPLLVNEGHRIKTDWLYHFLDNVTPIRPWLKIRMPSFVLNNNEKNQIISYFQHKAKQNTFEDDPKKLSWEEGEKEAAQELFTKLQCTTCHTTGFTKDIPSAPDLHLAAARLRPSWIEEWLKNPQKIVSSTTMPAFWENGQSQEPTILGGDAQKQIRAVTKYLILELNK
jgi:mono/diheme cytochrome c family protein